METIYISDNKLYRLGKLKGILYIYYLKNMKKIIKVLSEYEIEDKEYILNQLYRNRKDIPSEIVIPEYLVKRESFNGYIVPFIEGYNLSSILNSKQQELTITAIIEFIKES